MPRRTRAGFTLLALLLILAAMTLVTAMTLQLGEDERRGSSLMRHDARALALAEVGLERTRAYLAAAGAGSVDLDRVLDPGLDTGCTNLPTLDGTRDDDHLPAFTNGTAVVLPGSGKRFLRVPYDEGAYLVRIDDNDDDVEDLQDFALATSNNAGGGCSEGPALAKNNPVRDRDQTVIVTVMGIFPGTDVDTAQARKVLRVRVGPQPASGIIAGGTIAMDGASHVCGAHGDISSTGSITGTGCICGTGCKGGPPAYQQCKSNETCLAQSSGSTCNTSGGGSGSTCVPGAVVPPPPAVNVWSSANAPGPCVSGVCTPFYYLRRSLLGGLERTQVFMWDYGKSGCDQPQSCSRISHPGEAPTGPCSSCWTSVYTAAAGCLGEVRKADDPALTAATPSTWVATCDKKVALAWSAGLITTSTTTNCDTGTGTYPGPAVSRWSKDVTFAGNFETASTLLPRGVWMVEGNVKLATNTSNCAALPAGWGVTLLAQGNVLNEAEIYLRPAHPRGIALLAGRDMDFKTGNTTLHTCGTSAAVLAHEQFSMGANSHLEAQLVVENAGKCSAVASSPAISLHGNATIDVPQRPPVTGGAIATTLNWSESSY